MRRDVIWFFFVAFVLLTIIVLISILMFASLSNAEDYGQPCVEIEG